MTKQEMENVLTQAANRLIASQPDVFAFTEATRQSEWNIVGHFANELRKEFSDLHCDTDVKSGFRARLSEGIQREAVRRHG